MLVISLLLAACGQPGDDSGDSPYEVCVAFVDRLEACGVASGGVESCDTPPDLDESDLMEYRSCVAEEMEGCDPAHSADNDDYTAATNACCERLSGNEVCG